MISFSKKVNEVIELADIHCHILPFVDDGASDLEDAKDLLIEEYSQGARLIVFTPHFRYGMFETSVDKIHKYFEELKEFVSESNLADFELFISREYYCDERFSRLLDGYKDNADLITYEETSYNPKEEIIPFGENNCILMEFSSSRMQDKDFEIFINKASNAGLTPIIAHAERCPAIQKRPTIVDQMIDQGAYIQVNCESILAKNKTNESETARLLVQNQMVDILSSDAHDLEYRKPNLKKCYSLIEKRYGKKTADKLLFDNAMSLVYGR